MKHIEKGQEPESFTNWKGRANEDWQPTYSALRGREKKDVHCSLVEDQGGICCYCGSAIRRSTSHIEHLFPQGLCTEEEKLDYRNLLASCNCGTRRFVDSECHEPFDEERSILMQNPETELAIEGEHCGGKKKNWYHATLLVSPLNPECSTYFTFGRMTGNIRPVDDPTKQQAAQETIDRLGLDCSRLQKGRWRAFRGALNDLDELTKEEIRTLIQAFGERNSQGMFEEYCFAIVSVLERHLAFLEVRT